MSGSNITSFLISLSLIAITAIIGFLANRYWNRVKEQRTLERRIAELEKQVSLLTQTVVPISVAFQAILVKQLTHDHTPEADKLLAKIGPPNILSDAEMVDLLLKLDLIAHDVTIEAAERDAARMLPMVMERVKAEEEAGPVEVDPQIVAVPRAANQVQEKKEEEEAD